MMKMMPRILLCVSALFCASNVFAAAEISISADTPSVSEEGSTDIVFDVIRIGSAGNDFNVTVSFSGDAKQGIDFELVSLETFDGISTGEIDPNPIPPTGNDITFLMDDEFQSGFYEANWAGLDDAGVNQPKGIYLYRLRVQNANMNVELTKRLILK